MSHVTDEQLLAQIKAGKSIAWLAGATGWSQDELEAFADERGYVFGSNGVPRRSAVPLAEPPRPPVVLDEPDLQAAATDGLAELREAFPGRALASVAPELYPPQEPSPPGPDEMSTSGPPGGEADQADLVRRDVTDDQADLEFERALDAIEELDWQALVGLGSRSAVPETRILADTITEEVGELRRLLIEEREAAAALNLAASELRDAVLTEEQLATQLEALRERIEQLAPANQVRAWATRTGRRVGPRGSIPDQLRRDYIQEVTGLAAVPA